MISLPDWDLVVVVACLHWMRQCQLGVLAWVSEAFSPEKKSRTVSGDEMTKSAIGRSEIVYFGVEGAMLGWRPVLMWCRMMTVSSMMPKYRLREAAIEKCFRATGELFLSLQPHTTSACEYGPTTMNVRQKKRKKPEIAKVITCAILLPWAGEPVLLERRLAPPLT